MRRRAGSQALHFENGSKSPDIAILAVLSAGGS
jgi:hypothetical protein